MSKLVPVYRKESKHLFVDSDLIKPKVVELNGIFVLTAPLKVNQSFSLLGISQNEELLEAGEVDMTDSIGPVVLLDRIYLLITVGEEKEVLSVSTLDSETSKFISNDRVNKYKLNLDYFGDDINYPIKNSEKYFKFRLTLSGMINLELGETIVHSNLTTFKLTNVKDGSTCEAEVEVLGYDLNATRVNHNRK